MVLSNEDKIFEKKLEFLNLLLLLKVVFTFRVVWLYFSIFLRIRGRKRDFGKRSDV